MKNDNYGSITFAHFINLIEELSALEDLLRYFENEEAMHIERNRDTLEPIIAELLQYSAMYQRAIRAHLEECREWDAFPEEFWMASNKQQTIVSYTERYPWNDALSSKVKFVFEGVNRVKKLADNCLRDYQHSGYIGHQPVAIDFLDCLIDMHGQLYDACNCFNEIIQSNIQPAD